ncbi:hypothetical protein [Paenibacillus larvae]|uniref:hypothetical protein n=1 Tax=Paenibacillus larvae TaxID=1464 RepID=UPI000CE94983|nr:hypothetical protein ERICII_00536 [Paenibacillus larvae subsp. larvae DSM 25430]
MLLLAQVVADLIRKKEGELKQHLSPVLNPAGPFAGDIHRRQIEHFKQGFVARKDTFALCHFPKLTVVALDHIGCIDESSDLRRILEKGSQFCPVISPRPDNERVFGAPYLFKTIQFQ